MPFSAIQDRLAQVTAHPGKPSQPAEQAGCSSLLVNHCSFPKQTMLLHAFSILFFLTDTYIGGKGYIYIILIHDMSNEEEK